MAEFHPIQCTQQCVQLPYKAQLRQPSRSYFGTTMPGKHAVVPRSFSPIE